MAGALEGVVAFVSCRADGYMDPTPTIHNKLRAMGAQVATRLSKDVTHIVFRRKANPSAQERGLEDADLRMLHDKASKMTFPVPIVTTLWVSRSQELGRRALEGHFMLGRPPQPTATEQALMGGSKTPGSSKPKGSKQRRNSLKRLKAEEIEFDLESPMFSSSQQLEQLHDPESLQENTVLGAGRFVEGSKPVRQKKAKTPEPRPLRERLGMSGGHWKWHAVQGGDREPQSHEAFSTPKAARRGRRRSHGDTRGVSFPGFATNPPPVISLLPSPGPPAAAPSFATPAPRLPPRNPALAASSLRTPPSATIVDLITPAKPAGSSRATDPSSTPLAPCCSPSYVPSSVPSTAKKRQGSAAPSGPLSSRLAPGLRPPAALLTPPLPSTAALATPKLRQPKLAAVVVLGPDCSWKPLAGDKISLAQQLRIAAEEGSGDDEPQILEPPENAEVGFATQDVATTLLSFGGSEAKPAGDDLPARGCGGSTRLAISAVNNPLFVPAGLRSYNNSVFVPTLRAAGDCMEAAGEEEADEDSLPSWGCKRTRSPRSIEGRGKRPLKAPGTPASGASIDLEDGDDVPCQTPVDANKKRRLEAAPAVSLTPAASASVFPTAASAPSGRRLIRDWPQGASRESAGGFVTSTSVTAAQAEALKGAVRKLRAGFRLCPDGREATHLVVGAERRTLKVLQAITQGAWLMSPKWVEESLRAGRWLPEDEFEAKVRFSIGAARSRERIASLGGLGLLEGYRVHVSDRGEGARRAKSNAEVLRRLATSLGAQVVPARGCSLCIVTGGTGRPQTVSLEVPVVEEEWLYHCVEKYEALNVDPWLVKA